MNFFNKFKLGLNKTSSLLSANIFDALSSKRIDAKTLDKIESILLSCDIGVNITEHLINKIKSTKISDPVDFKHILKILSEELELILKPREKILINNEDKKPNLLLFVGVNGSGKTTTIGKLINIIPKGKKILIVACDTFRAAAIAQLKEWSIKENVDFFQGSLNQDPASVAYNACVKAKKEEYDYIIIDTAGRLSNNANLLNQLVKIKSVIKKNINEECIKTILVLDGTNGSNMINQVDLFGKSIDINGLIITKIDGTAKGGAIISIAKKFEIPIHLVGLGEKKDDLHNFNAKNYAESMLGVES